VDEVAAAEVAEEATEEAADEAAAEDEGAAAADEEEEEAVSGVALEDPEKLDEALVSERAAMLTFLTVTTLPRVLVTRTSTVSLPKPLAFWKKL
jgi:hypothetical protein